MNPSFGIDYNSSSRVWEDVRRGPPLDAVREHLDRVVNFGRYSSKGHYEPGLQRR